MKRIDHVVSALLGLVVVSTAACAADVPGSDDATEPAAAEADREKTPASAPLEDERPATERASSAPIVDRSRLLLPCQSCGPLPDPWNHGPLPDPWLVRSR